MPRDGDPVKTTQELVSRLASARSLYERGEHDEALDEYRGLLEEARGSAMKSPSLLAAAALAALATGETAESVRLAEAALRLDPLSFDARCVLDGAAAQAGRLLASPERTASDPETPRLYHLLVRTGRADTRSALALARFHEARGDRAIAAALRDAVRVIARDVPPPGEPPFAAALPEEPATWTFPIPGVGEA
jgi:tetratricopeptide (TPR) repeat protein